MTHGVLQASGTLLTMLQNITTMQGTSLAPILMTGRDKQRTPVNLSSYHSPEKDGVWILNCVTNFLIRTYSKIHIFQKSEKKCIFSPENAKLAHILRETCEVKMDFMDIQKENYTDMSARSEKYLIFALVMLNYI